MNNNKYYTPMNKRNTNTNTDTNTAKTNVKLDESDFPPLTESSSIIKNMASSKTLSTSYSNSTSTSSSTSTTINTILNFLQAAKKVHVPEEQTLINSSDADTDGDADAADAAPFKKGFSFSS